MNAEEGLVKLQAVVEPNLFLRALAGTGPHAEPKWVKLRHPKMSRSYYSDYDTYGNGYNHGSTIDPYSYTHTLPEYPYSTMEPTYPHYHGSDPYYSGRGMGLPPTR